MYVTEVPNRGAKPTVLLRESYRDDGKVKTRTLANLTHLPPHVLDAVKRAAKNEALVNATDTFHIERSRHHGHVEAVLAAMRRLNIEKLIASEHSRERDLILAMMA